ncbi:MAG: single-stranded-DNA-specific exonuclease RecJ [Chlorobiaceae bacterium]|nr:single-stranded-DNA-specific exonuclease RecJ [Chlorobiaceae bacterium]NTW10341.1 single-stranded-DNA-specific exonuclease RecJ [Chlorobiaceae bacterium]
MKRYRWTLLTPDEQSVAALSEAINVTLPIARALCNRGIGTFEEAKAFFRSSMPDLPSPFLMEHMRQAAERVVKAIGCGEKIMLYGDYDVDGTTGTAMLYLFLKEHGADISYYINDRFSEGYGLSDEGIDLALGNGTGLIVTVDCGIRENTAIRRCCDAGVDVIVCDHHEADELPPAYAILNPKVPGTAYPFRELCGCGVAFKFIQAISELMHASPESCHKYLDLVAIATAADMVVLEKENRTIVREGLERIRNKPRDNISQMFSLMKVAPSDVDMYHIVFGIAPRINAAGRMHSANLAVEWLLSEVPAESKRYAGELDRMNVRRREIDSDIMKKAESMLESHFASYCSSIVLYDESWHLGVLGIVASKLLEKYYLPTVILGNMNGFIRGSVRSVSGLNVYEALQECSEYLEQFGGHHQAAGITLRAENYERFRRKFDEICGGYLSLGQRQKELKVDSVLSLEEITGKFIKVLEQFAPFGYGNREPLFVSPEITLFTRPNLLRQRHVKFSVRDSFGRNFDVIGFDRPDIYEKLRSVSNPVFTMLFTVEKRIWNRREEFQIKLKDLDILSRQKK